MHVPVAEISTKVELAIILAQTVPCYMPIPLSPSDLMGHESIHINGLNRTGKVQLQCAYITVWKISEVSAFYQFFERDFCQILVAM